MPPIPSVNRKEILNAAVSLVRSAGIDAVNARSLADVLGCSTKPLFRVYANMDALKQDVLKQLDAYYNSFMSQRICPKNRLLTQSIAYVEFARQEPNIFNTLFMNRTCQGKSTVEILDADWNQESIRNAQEVTGLSLEQTRCLFRDVWLYSHGIATQIVSNAINLPQKEVVRLMQNAFDRFSAPQKK